VGEVGNPSKLALEGVQPCRIHTVEGLQGDALAAIAIEGEVDDPEPSRPKKTVNPESPEVVA
jgi:hypothetical protein